MAVNAAAIKIVLLTMTKEGAGSAEKSGEEPDNDTSKAHAIDSYAHVDSITLLHSFTCVYWKAIT